MTGAEQQQYRERLLQLQAELQAALVASEEATAPVSPDSALGRLTRLDAMQSQQMALALRQRQQVRLQQVEQALRLLEQGEYGVCRKCGADISPKRLEVTPESALCIACAR